MAEEQFVVFRLGEEEYSVNILQVQTIERMLTITEVPNAPQFVEGVTNLRGTVVPVIDFRKRLNLPEKEITDETRIITVKINNIMVGLKVDSASEVVKVPNDSIETAPSIIGGIESNYVAGIAKLTDRLLIILKLKAVLNQREVDQLKDINAEI